MVVDALSPLLAVRKLFLEIDNNTGGSTDLISMNELVTLCQKMGVAAATPQLVMSKSPALSLNGYDLPQAEGVYRAVAEALGKKVMKGKWDRPLNASAAATALVQSILVVAPHRRATLPEICRSEWVLAGASGPEEVVPFEGHAAALHPLLPSKSTVRALPWR